MKIFGSSRTKEEESEHQEENCVQRNLNDGVIEANHDMEGQPSEEKPASPVVAEQQEDASHDSKQAKNRKEKKIVFERALGEVIAQAERSHEDKQAAENQDW